MLIGKKMQSLMSIPFFSANGITGYLTGPVFLITIIWNA